MSYYVCVYIKHGAMFEFAKPVMTCNHKLSNTNTFYQLFIGESYLVTVIDTVD